MSFDRDKFGKSDLEKYFENNNKRLIHKWLHYFDIYERHFSRFRGKPITIMEIGISHGGSLQMWKDYFGSEAKIIGIDINPKCKEFEEDQIKVFIGSQSDRSFLKDLKKQIPKVDILIDDGGHTMRQQKVTFQELFDHVKEDGVYLCEDLHTSYWTSHGGGLKRGGTFIEFTKGFIDQLHAYHSQQRNFKVNSFTSEADSIHYYNSVVVVEKRLREAPYDAMTGRKSYKTDSTPVPEYKGILYSLRSRLLRSLNRFLRLFRIRDLSSLSGFWW